MVRRWKSFQDSSADEMHSHELAKYWLGEAVLATTESGSELAVHPQVSRVAEYLVDLASIPIGTLWLVERGDGVGSVGPVVGDYIQAPIHKTGGRGGTMSGKHQVVCGPTPAGVVRVEAVVGGRGRATVHLGSGVFLLTSPMTKHIVLNQYDEQGALVRRYGIPPLYQASLTARVQMNIERAPMAPPPTRPDEPPGWVAIWFWKMGYGVDLGWFLGRRRGR